MCAPSFLVLTSWSFENEQGSVCTSGGINSLYSPKSTFSVQMLFKERFVFTRITPSNLLVQRDAKA